MPKKKKAKKMKAVKKKAPSKSKKNPVKKSARKSAKKTSVKASAAGSSAPAPKSAGLVPLAPKAPPKIAGEKFVGEVEDFFGKISVIALTLKEALSLGDAIHVKGHTTDFSCEVKSMQIDLKPITAAKRGDSVGIKVGDKARKGDNVYRIG